MDAMEVLGALLGRKSKSGGLGGRILEGILKGGTKSSRPPTRSSQPTPRHREREQPGGDSGYRHSDPTAPADAPSLDDLLRDAFGRHHQRQSAPRPTTRPTEPPRRSIEPNSSQDLAVVLIRAMINAAKSDGHIDRHEQDNILKQLGDLSQSERDFVRDEFSRPLDVRQFAWDVPIGQEEQVYTMSLLAIDLDQNKEASYLQELAHGLRLSPSACNRIHDRLNAPRIH